MPAEPTSLAGHVGSKPYAARLETYMDGGVGARIDVDGIASTVHAIVSTAMNEAHEIAAQEVVKANSMTTGVRCVIDKDSESVADDLSAVVAEAFPERVAWTTCSTTTTISTTDLQGYRSSFKLFRYQRQLRRSGDQPYPWRWAIIYISAAISDDLELRYHYYVNAICDAIRNGKCSSATTIYHVFSDGRFPSWSSIFSYFLCFPN